MMVRTGLQRGFGLVPLLMTSCASLFILAGCGLFYVSLSQSLIAMKAMTAISQRGLMLDAYLHQQLRNLGDVSGWDGSRYRYPRITLEDAPNGQTLTVGTVNAIGCISPERRREGIEQDRTLYVATGSDGLSLFCRQGPADKMTVEIISGLSFFKIWTAYDLDNDGVDESFYKTTPAHISAMPRGLVFAWRFRPHDEVANTISRFDLDSNGMVKAPLIDVDVFMTGVRLGYLQ